MITALESLPTTIARLRTIATLAVDHRIMPFGVPALDDRLASRGLRAGALHEVAAQTCSMVDDAAATLFLAGIAAREAAHSQASVSFFGSILLLVVVVGAVDQRCDGFEHHPTRKV